jgi:hypothetical protein
MQERLSAQWRLVLAATLIVCAFAHVGCSPRRDTSLIGTFQMGERVQVGPLVYTILESEWKTALSEGGAAPKNRFLFLRLSIMNSGSQPVASPGLTLLGPGDVSYPEMTDNLEQVSNSLGMLRNIAPGQTQNGYVVFDAPMGAYKLVVSDGGEIEHERHAHIEIPVHLE